MLEFKGKDRARLGGWIALLAMLTAFYLINASSEFGGSLGGDNVMYFLLGKAIATGQGYVDLYLPGNPPHGKFPPLFPLSLAPFHLVFEKPLYPMHAALCFMSALSAVVLGWWAGKRSRFTGAGFLFALAFATLPKLYIHSTHLLSEPLYMLVAYSAIVLASPGRDKEASNRKVLGAALLCVAAFLTRSAGIAVVAAVLISFFLEGRRVRFGHKEIPAWLMLLTLFIIVAGAWFGRNMLIDGGGPGYFEQFLRADPYDLEKGTVGFSGFMTRIWESGGYYFAVLGLLGFTPAWLAAPAGLANLAGALVLAVAALGMIADLKRGGGSALFIFTLVTVLEAVVWPYMDERFIYPVLPAMLFYVVSGVRWIAGLVSERSARRAAVALLAMVLVSQAAATYKVASRRLTTIERPKEAVYVIGVGSWKNPVIDWSYYDIENAGSIQEVEETMEFYTNYLIINLAASSVVPEDAVIMSRKPMYTYYLSGRNSVPVLPDARVEKQLEYILENDVDYIVTGLDEWNVLGPIFEERPDLFRVRAQIEPGHWAIYEVNKSL